MGAHHAGIPAALRGDADVPNVGVVVPSPASLPLAGVRVIDLADLSGALAGRILAGLGAEVVLVEPPGGHHTRGPLFDFYHAGKRSIVADRSCTSGRETVAALATRADVIVTTDPPGDAAALARRHPQAIVASLTPFGHGGPLADWRLTDLTAQAVGGMLYLNGHADGGPVQLLGLQAYHQASIFAVVGALAGLLERDRSGHGQLVDVSLQAAVAAALEYVPGRYHQTGEIARRQGTLHWTRAFRAGRCRDGWVVHSTMGDWTSLVEWVRATGGADEAARLDDPAFEDEAVRRARAEEVFDTLDRWAAQHDAEGLHQGGQLRRLPYAAVRSLEMLPHHPQLRDRDFFVSRAPLGDGDLRPFPTLPFLLDGIRLPVGDVPRPGQHQRSVEAQWLDMPPAVRPGRPVHPATAPPLAGLDVLDFTWVVAGPIATRVLADLGARVVKVEHPRAPDFGDRRGGITGSLMRGKESVVIDLACEDGRVLARQLAARADVVIDNFSARVMPALGLDAATLSCARPDLICVRMSGYGRGGRHEQHVSYGPTLQALAGFTAAMGHAGEPPAGAGYSYSDVASGHLAAVAVLAAVWRRRRHGTGADVDLSQLECLASLVPPHAASDGPTGPTGNSSQEGAMAPHGVYRAAGDDRWLAVAVPDDAAWRGLCMALDRPDLADDPRYATAAVRCMRQHELDHLLAAWAHARSPEDAAAALQRAGVPAAWVADARFLCDHDPQLTARRHFVEVERPEGGAVRFDGSPVRFARTPVRITRPGPLLGEHTRVVLSERLGLDAPTLARLEADGVIVQAARTAVP